MTLDQALDILFRQGFAVFIACVFVFRLDKTMRALHSAELKEHDLLESLKELLERKLQ